MTISCEGQMSSATHAGLCGVSACGQAVSWGVCDTPELWRGAVGLCARVRACAGAAEYLRAYLHTYPRRVVHSDCIE